MEFIVRQLSSRPDTILVRYDCPCGCKPNAEYQQGSQEVNFEHCCCGNIHFVGHAARAKLDAYLSGRKALGMLEDMERGNYAVSETAVDAPWGERVPVAFGIPANPTKH